MTEQKTETEIVLDGTYYKKFIDGLKADATKTGYINSIKRYMSYLRITDANQLMVNTDPIAIEDQIVEYIMSLRNAKVAYSTIKFLVAPIFTFYALN